MERHPRCAVRERPGPDWLRDAEGWADDKRPALRERLRNRVGFQNIMRQSAKTCLGFAAASLVFSGWLSLLLNRDGR